MECKEVKRILYESAASPEPFCIIASDNNEEVRNKCFLGGVPATVTEKSLEDIFSRFGKVKDVRIVTDRVTAECKGYGFVTFDEGDNIESLLALKNIEVNGKKIRVRKANRRSSTQFDEVSTSTGIPIRNEKILIDNQLVCISTSGDKQSILKPVATIPLSNQIFTDAGVPGNLVLNNLSDIKEQRTLHVMQHFEPSIPTFIVTSQQMPYFIQQSGPSVFSPFNAPPSPGYYTTLGIPQLAMMMPPKNLHVFPHYNK